MTASRTIVIGDVHGCLDELDALLKATEHRAGVDRLVLTGDLLDRGPDPVGVVRRVRELNAEVVMGNHEDKHLRFHAHEQRHKRNPRYRNPMRNLPEIARVQHAQLRDDDVAFLERMPAFVRLDAQWVVVHGGFEPGIAIDQQKTAVMLRVRYVDRDNRFVPLHRRDDTDPHIVPWATRWRGPESVVYGHHVQDLQHPRVEQPVPGVYCYGIDTGCCFGGRLTALVLPARQIVQVSAKQPYAPLQMDD